MRRRVGRPLLRTAVVAGGAYAVGSSAARRHAEQEYTDAAQSAQIDQLQQQQGYGAPPPPMYAPPPQSYAPPSPPSTYEQPAPRPMAEPAAAMRTDPMAALKQLGELKAAGVITQEEFDAKKADLLAQI